MFVFWNPHERAKLHRQEHSLKLCLATLSIASQFNSKWKWLFYILETLQCKPKGVQNGEIKDPTISMSRLTVMYKDSVTKPGFKKKWVFAKHLEYLLKHSALPIKLITTPDMTSILHNYFNLRRPNTSPEVLSGRSYHIQCMPLFKFKNSLRAQYHDTLLLPPKKFA